MKHSIMQNQLKLTRKLHHIYPEIKTVLTDNLDINKELNNIYYNKKKRHWFSKIEYQGKAYYIFGKDKTRNIIRKNNILLIIDIDLNQDYNPECLGRLVKIKGNIKLLLNNDIFKQKYPQINTDMFHKSNITSNKNSVRYIDLGFINRDFITNLEIILTELEKTPNKAEKTPDKTEKNSCKICGRNKKSIKVNDNISKIQSKNPEFCGECLEKIIACEFYEKIRPQLKNNETKSINIAREKFANDEVFNYGLKLLEKYNILRYIGVKKLLFSIDDKNPVLIKYQKYADNNLIDVLIKNNASQQKYKMNMFLNALKEGKTHEEAYKIANIHPKTFKQWYDKGNEGDMDYIDFYDKYAEFKPPQKHLKQFIKTLREYQNIEKTLKICKTDIKTVKNWYDKGKDGSIDYKWFYNEFNRVIPDDVTNSNNKDNELINRYVELRNQGKTNSQVINELEIPQEKINEWIKQAKNGNKKYSNFYTTYHEKEIRCEVCGRKINKNSNKKICKRCAKKQFAAKILIKILKVIEPGKTFKKDELELLNLQPIQITEYLWTLKEFNLITEKNNKYQLKNRKELEEFLKGTGIDTYQIPEHAGAEAYRTCSRCGRKLPKSRFINNDNTCKDCKKQTNTAKYLMEIMEHVDCNSDFSENDLKEHFKNPIKLQAKIWALVDNNLARKNFEDDTYTLADEKTVNEFLIKYGDGENIKPHNDMEIMAPLPEDVKKQMKITKTNKTGFAWVNKSGKKYYYTRKYDNKQVRISADTINELYQKVIKEGEVWGVRDIDKAKNTLQLNENETESEFKDPGIYAPLPQNYSEKFSKQTKETGIAWVSKNKNNFIYSRKTDGKHIEFNAPDIIQLYKKVKSENQLWGITDYDNASKFIEIPENVKKENITEKTEDTGIYAPLNEKYLKNFRKENETGIAWVNKTGNKYTYTRHVNSKIHTISDPDIYELYRKVKSEKMIWGIRNYKKASKIIDIPENLIEEKDESETGFYCSLPEKYLNDCEKTNTGIAWVNKTGDKWIYNLKIKDKIIRLTDSDVFRLYEKVLSNNGIWGITDLKKAKEIVEDKKIPVKTKSSKINVNFIQKTKNKYDVLIKGTIKSTELFEILKCLEEYENNIKRIMTTTIKNNVDLFIEMELNQSRKKQFEIENKNYGWKIN